MGHGDTRNTSAISAQHTQTHTHTHKHTHTHTGFDNTTEKWNIVKITALPVHAYNSEMANSHRLDKHQCD